MILAQSIKYISERNIKPSTFCGRSSLSSITVVALTTTIVADRFLILGKDLGAILKSVWKILCKIDAFLNRNEEFVFFLMSLGLLLLLFWGSSKFLYWLTHAGPIVV